MTQEIEKLQTCCMCGQSHPTVHECGDDYQCDRCCLMYMDSPAPIEKWLDIITAHAIEQKRKLQKFEELNVSV